MKNKKEFLLFILIGFTLLLSVSTFIITLEQRLSNNNDKIEDIEYPPENPKPDSFETDNSYNNLIDLLKPPEINYESFSGFDKVYGLKKQIRRLNEVKDRFTNSDQYLIQKNKDEVQKYIATNTKQNTKSELPKGMIFYGPPGTGKTYLAKCCAKEFKMNFYIITPADSLKDIEEKFLRARKNSPSIIFADEAEEIVKTRDGTFQLEQGDTKKTDLILAELDGVKTQKDKPIYFIAATNYIEKIDSAIQSRLEKMYLGHYSPKKRLGYLEVMAKRNNIHPDAYKYLRIIVEKINFAEKNKEKLSLEIIKGIRDLPAIGLNKRKTDDKTLKELIEQKEYLNQIENVTGIRTKEELKEILQTKLREDSRSLFTQEQKDEFINKYKEISDDEYYMFLKTLDELKRHFKDITSARKLEFLINNAANKAGLYSKNRQFNGIQMPVILISDLEESLSEYLGKLSKKYRTDTQLNDNTMPDNPFPPSTNQQI